MTTAVDLTDRSPTSRWLAAAPVLPPLRGPEAIAERLLLLLHYGIDWDGSWVGKHRSTYWDHQLPDRVAVATFMTASIKEWWCLVADDLCSAPRSAAERMELAQLLEQSPREVLHCLRAETAALTLRVRIVTEHVRATKASRS